MQKLLTDKSDLGSFLIFLSIYRLFVESEPILLMFALYFLRCPLSLRSLLS